MGLENALRKAKHSAIKNADILMTIAAIGGFATTIYFAVKRTPRAQGQIYDTMDRIEGIIDEGKEKRWPKKEVDRAIRIEKGYLVKDLFVTYLPAIASGAGTIGFIIGTNKVNRERNAVLTGALNASNIMYEELYNKTKEAIGENKAEKLVASIKEEHVNRAPIPPKNTIVETGKGQTLCATEIEPGNSDTMIFFRSSPQAVEASRNEANAYLVTGDNKITQADLLYFLGLDVKGQGTQLRCHRMRRADDLIEFKYDSFIHADLGEPVLFISTWNEWEY